MAGRTQSPRATTNRAPRRSIARKLALLVALAVFAAAAAMSSFLIWQELTNYAETKSRNLLGIAHVFASATARATANRDQPAAYQAMKAIAHIPELSYARVEIGRGQPLAIMGGATQLDKDIRISDSKPGIAALDLLKTHSIQAEVPIIEGGVTVGRFFLVAETNDLAGQLLASLRGAGLGAAAALALGLLVATQLQRGLTRPLYQLNDTIWRIRRSHDYTDRVTAVSNDEVGLLIDGFNAMLEEIEERDTTLEAIRHNLENEVTERTHDLSVAKDAAESANASKSDFLATMSHEIRTPMNGVLVMAELLAASELPHRQRRYAEVISKSGHSLLAIINDILDFTKIEAGKLEFEQIAVDPADVAEHVTSLFGERAREKGLDLAAYVAPKTPRFITGDPVRITQIISNLVNNALKFTESGSVILQITPDPRNLSRIRFAVSDTGVGIPSHKLGDIFSAFTQADQSTTRRFGGTGLGLAISKRLIEAMGGELKVASRVGEGSTFYFALPMGEHSTAESWPRVNSALATALVAMKGDATRDTLSRYLTSAGYDVKIAPQNDTSMPADVVIADPDRLGGMRRLEDSRVICLARLGDANAQHMVREGKADAMIAQPLARSEIVALLRKVTAGEALRDAGETVASPPLELSMHRGLSVLVADDTAINREVAIETLTRLGAHVTTAENGLEAITAMDKSDFDIVLMDVSMPELDGFEATRRIRAAEASSKLRRTPIIAVTAHVVGSAADAWRDAGMDAVLYKPYTLKSLAECLARFAPAETRQPIEPAHALQTEASSAPSPVAIVEAAPSPGALNEATSAQLHLVARSGPAGFLQRIFSLYLDNAPRSVDDMTRALANQDFAAVARAAHALKSMSLNIGADAVVAKAAEIEQRAGSERPVATPQDIEELKAVLAQTCSAVSAHKSADKTPAPRQAVDRS